MMDKKDIKILPMDIYRKPIRKDVVGDAGKFIDDFIISMESEKIYKCMGVSPDKSFLITGPPGNGKTMGIEALVNETNKNQFKKSRSDIDTQIPINMYGFKYDIGTYGTAYINQGSRVVQQFFDICFNVAYSGYKTLVVFDEAETLFGKRNNNLSHKEDTKVLNTIMKNMQTLHDTDNMYAVMMSNFPSAFDDASIRAGRVDKRYEFNNPGYRERVFAYNHIIEQINNTAKYKVVRGYNADILSDMSNGFSYSDVSESVRSAVKKRATEISKTRKDKIITAGYISQNRIEESIKKHKSKFITNTDNSKKIGFI